MEEGCEASRFFLKALPSFSFLRTRTSREKEGWCYKMRTTRKSRPEHSNNGGTGAQGVRRRVGLVLIVCFPLPLVRVVVASFTLFLSLVWPCERC